MDMVGCLFQDLTKHTGSLIIYIRACIRPDHLYLGSHLDNMKDRKQAGMYGRDYNGRTKVSQSDLSLIALYHKRGMSAKDLAKMYGVHVSTIFNCLRIYKNSLAGLKGEE